MSTRKSFALAAAASLLLAGCAEAGAKPAPAPQRPVMSVKAAAAPAPASSLVTRVIAVSVSRIASPQAPRTVLICARGTVPGPGWTDPQLRPVFYNQAPRDGIWDIDFIASPPPGPVAQAVTPIKVTLAWRPQLPSFRGVRVRSATNSTAALLNEDPSAC